MDSKSINIEGYFYPILASLENDTPEARMEKWNKFRLLPELMQNKISSKNTADRIRSMASLFNLELYQIDAVSRSIRNYFFGKLKLEDMPLCLSKEAAIDLTRAQEISKQIVDRIINDQLVEKSYQANLLNITVQEALKNYPELGEQLITTEKIMLHSFPEPVRPSIKNWLTDYTFTLGQDKRGAMERSRYLFQNANARNLKGEDRQRLSYILRVYDENLPVTINKATRRVIFSAVAPEPPATSSVSAPKTQPDFSQSHEPGSVHFSSPQQLPYERKNSPNVLNITRLEEKPKPLPNNVVNLKDTDN